MFQVSSLREPYVQGKKSKSGVRWKWIWVENPWDVLGFSHQNIAAVYGYESSPKTWCGRFGCIPISCNVNPKFINPAWLIRGFTELTPKLWVHTLMITRGFQQNAGLTLHTPLTRCAKLRGTPSWKCQRHRLKLLPFGQKNEQRINGPMGVPPSLGNFLWG